jgi:hypothetical protein
MEVEIFSNDVFLSTTLAIFTILQFLQFYYSRLLQRAFH